MKIKKQLFGKLDNIEIIKYSLIAANGFQVDILNYGGVITGIWLPDKNNIMDNIVLAYDNFVPYINNPHSLGTITGRYAGRIGNARFNLDNKEYILIANNGINNLHGGPVGLSRRIWSVIELSNGLNLSYFSPDGEDGFPANISFEVNYLISDQHQLNIIVNALPDNPTIINLTNHTYFNLSGAMTSNSALDHLLMIDADYYAALDKNFLPTLPLSSVNNTPFSFKTLKPIGQNIINNDLQLKLAGGYDHPFKLNNINKPNIYLSSSKSGRNLTITTNEEYVVFYTGNHLPEPHLGICLETQLIPNAINLPDYQERSVYTKEKPYYSNTIWQFSTDGLIS